MVWSQREGLRLQDVVSSTGEKKASLLWNTESMRIVMSSPKCADCGESSNSKDVAGAGGDFNHLRLKPNCEGANFETGSPRNTSPRMEGYMVRIDGHESRNFGDLKTSNKIGPDKEILRNNQSAEKEAENNAISVDTLRTNTHKVDTILQDKYLFSGPDNTDQNAEQLKELRFDIPLASESNIRRNLSYSNMGKGKQVIGDSEERTSSTASEESHDSVESCNSEMLVSPGKQARSYDLEMSAVNKKLKKQVREGSSSGSFLRRESSFMNWVSTITNGFSRFAGATPLAFAPPPTLGVEGNPNFLSLSHVGSKDIGITCRNTGFKSFFQSLYLPAAGFKLKRDMNGYCPTDASAKELQVESEQFGYSSSQIERKSMEFNLHRILPTGGGRVNCVSKYHSRSEQINASSLNNEVSMPEERLTPSTNDNVSPGDSSFPENQKCAYGGEGTGALSAVDSSSERSVLLQNLWISRFSPKVSSNKPNSSQHMQCMDLSAETLDPQFQNIAATSKDQGCSENSCLPPVQSQMSSIDAKKLESSKTGNQKRMSNLNPILPSPKFQKTERIVSTFAKRLDILRNPKVP